MKKILKVRNLVIGIAVLFLLIQLFRIDKNNPVSEKQLDFLEMTEPPEEIAQLIKTSCYDCHSNETVYPWYSNIAPVSWMLKSHIEEGRKHLNFSEWGSYQPGRRANKIDECKEMVEKDYMPLKPYKMMHPKSKFSPAQKELLVDWLTVE